MTKKNHSRRAVTAALTVALAAFALYGAAQNYTGDGGKGISLTIYVPQSTGLPKEQSYIPALVQGELVSNFSNYSAISILDWERLDDIYVKLIAEEYDDKAEAKMDVVLGRMAPTSHFLTGNITKTATGYNVKVNITATANKMTAAAYSGTFTVAELDNLTGVRRASLELLQKVGVKLTDEARRELAGTVEENRVLAQTALAKGVTAQRAGTEVAALSYYYQAANFNPSLNEAVKRSTVVAANITSGNIGADIRNDIVWRKKWVAKLTETEEILYDMINAADKPYTLTYFTDIRTKNVDYKKETADLSIVTSMVANKAWFAAAEPQLVAAGQAAAAVLEGLNATKRKKEWGLSGWPKVGVSKTNPFGEVNSASRIRYDISAVFELVNQQGRAIGRAEVDINPAFNIKRGDDGRYTVGIAGEDLIGAVDFKRVKADDISDKLTVRVASVNGAPPQKARFAIAAMPLAEKAKPFTDARDGKKYNAVKIGGKTWMAQNLNYQPKTGDSWCYKDSGSNCDKYGRLYYWNTATQVCPKGWHLPDRWEWRDLIVAVNTANGWMEGAKLDASTLKAKSGWVGSNNGAVNDRNGTDDYGFAALPGGQCSGSATMSFSDLGHTGYWWTATECKACGSGNPYALPKNKAAEVGLRYAYSWEMLTMYENSEAFERKDEFKNYGLSVRCVQD